MGIVWVTGDTITQVYIPTCVRPEAYRDGTVRIAPCTAGLLQVSNRTCDRWPWSSRELHLTTLVLLRSYRTHCCRCRVTFPIPPSRKRATFNSILWWQILLLFWICHPYDSSSVPHLPWHPVVLGNQAHWSSSLAETFLLMPEPLLRERTVTSRFFLILSFPAYTEEKELALKKLQHQESFLLLKSFSGLKGPV